MSKQTYAERIANYMAKHPGSTTREARGHRIKESLDYDKKLENARGIMQREGISLTQASKKVHVDRSRLSGYLGKQGILQRDKGKYFLTSDNRIREIQFIEQGVLKTIPVSGYENAKKISSYMNDVKRYFKTGNESILSRWKGLYITDSNGNKHYFETRKKQLTDIKRSGTLTFENLYRITR